MILQDNFLPLSSVLIYTLCFDTGHSHFSSARSQTLPLFTRGIIRHMATVCLQCQISYKEWLHCLLREMVANWRSPLLDECCQRTRGSHWRGICSLQSKENCSVLAAVALAHACRCTVIWAHYFTYSKVDVIHIWCAWCYPHSDLRLQTQWLQTSITIASCLWFFFLSASSN